MRTMATDYGTRAAGLLVWAWLAAVLPLAAQQTVEFQYLYDPNGQLVRVVDSLGQVVTYNYDAAGNLLSVSQTTTNQLGPPQIQSVTPPVVNAGETVQVLLEGTHLFLGQLTVERADLALLNPLVNDDRATARLRVPLDAALGPATLRLTTSLGTATAEIRVIGPLPKLARVLPPSGTAFGGTLLTLFGSSFTPDTEVAIGGINVVQREFLNSSTLRAVAPPGTPGQQVDIRLANANGSFVLPGAYGYFFPFSVPGARAFLVGTTDTLPVRLSEPAGANFLFSLASSASGVASVPASVTIPAGASEVLLPVSANSLGTTRLTVSLGNLALVAALFVVGPVSGDFDFATPPIGGIVPGAPSSQAIGGQVAPNLLPAVVMAPGTMRTLGLSLSQPAPGGGLTVLLRSTSPAVATVPPEVMLAADATVVAFELTALAAGSSFLIVQAGGETFRLHILVNRAVEGSAIVLAPIAGILAPSGADTGAAPLGTLVAPRDPTVAPIVGVEVR